jgi:hypothetical protein
MGTKITGFNPATLGHTATILEKRAAKYLADAMENDALDRAEMANDDRAMARKLGDQAKRVRAKIAAIEELM